MVYNTHSNLYTTFFISGNFDEIITITERNKQFVMTESTNVTKKRKRESTIIHGRPQKFFGGEQCRHFVDHFQIADDQCSL